MCQFIEWMNDPMNDRSIGYLIQGKAKTAVSNYGNYVEWSNFPPGLWGKYSYLWYTNLYNICSCVVYMHVLSLYSRLYACIIFIV